MAFVSPSSGVRAAVAVAALLGWNACTQEFDPALLEPDPARPSSDTRTVQALAAAGRGTCAADNLQTLWCWGEISGGRGVQRRPVALSAGGWTAVALGGRAAAHGCAIHFQGSLWCWGANTARQLGQDSGASADAPLLVADGPWERVATSETVSCAVRAGGALWCWGEPDRVPLTAATGLLQQVNDQLGYERIELGETHGCSIRQGVLSCWGENRGGQLGIGELVGETLALPRAIAGEQWRELAVGATHTCGIRRDQSLWCWGGNDFGQLGQGAAAGAAASPLRVEPASRWQVVAAGDAHTCAITDQGELYCWGSNERGQLGIDAAVAPSPVRVGERRDYRALALGSEHSCAVTAVGSVWCWGNNQHGQVGVGDAPVVPGPALVGLTAPR